MAKRIAILGAGESGVGAAILAKQQGYDVWLSDKGKIKDKYKQVLSNNEIKFLGNSIKIEGINFSKKDYYLGLRPEHLSVSENSEYKFNPKVDLIENLGNEKIAYIKMDQYEISAKIPSHHSIENSIGFNS